MSGLSELTGKNNATWHSLGRWGRFCYSVCMPRIYNKASKQELIIPTQYLENITFLRLSTFDLIISVFVISCGPNPSEIHGTEHEVERSQGSRCSVHHKLSKLSLLSALISLIFVILYISCTLHHYINGKEKEIQSKVLLTNFFSYTQWFVIKRKKPVSHYEEKHVLFFSILKQFSELKFL